MKWQRYLGRGWRYEVINEQECNILGLPTFGEVVERFQKLPPEDSYSFLVSFKRLSHSNKDLQRHTNDILKLFQLECPHSIEAKMDWDEQEKIKEILMEKVGLNFNILLKEVNTRDFDQTEVHLFLKTFNRYTILREKAEQQKGLDSRNISREQSSMLDNLREAFYRLLEVELPANIEVSIGGWLSKERLMLVKDVLEERFGGEGEEKQLKRPTAEEKLEKVAEKVASEIRAEKVFEITEKELREELSQIYPPDEVERKIEQYRMRVLQEVGRGL